MALLLTTQHNIPFAISALSYLIIANIVSGLTEFIGAGFGRGDIAAPMPAIAPESGLASDQAAWQEAPTNWGRRWYEQARAPGSFPRDKLRWQDMEEPISEAIMPRGVQSAFKYFGLNPKDVASNPEKAGLDLAMAYKDMTGFNLDVVSLDHVDKNMQVCRDWLKASAVPAAAAAAQITEPAAPGAGLAELAGALPNAEAVERIAAEAHRIRAVEDGTDQDFPRLSPDNQAANRESAAIAAYLVAEARKRIPASSIRDALNDAVELLGRGQPLAEEFGKKSEAHRFVLTSGVAQHEAWRARKERSRQVIREGLEKPFVGLNAIEQKKDLNFMIAAVGVLSDEKVTPPSAPQVAAAAAQVTGPATPAAAAAQITAATVSAPQMAKPATINELDAWSEKYSLLITDITMAYDTVRGRGGWSVRFADDTEIVIDASLSIAEVTDRIETAIRDKIAKGSSVMKEMAELQSQAVNMREEADKVKGENTDIVKDISLKSSGAWTVYLNTDDQMGVGNEKIETPVVRSA
jgi:hypothetical protein